MTTSSMNVRRLVYSAICLALCLVLPLLTGQIPQIGRMLSPMHIPVFLCGFLCGWPYGLAVGAIAPILRGAIFGMPVLFPTGIAMSFELAAYGFVSGLLFRALPKTTPYLYVDLVISMLCGRAVWGIVSFLLAGITQTEFSFGMFIAGAFTNAVPGIILHLLLIPAVVMAMVRAHLVLNASANRSRTTM